MVSVADVMDHALQFAEELVCAGPQAFGTETFCVTGEVGSRSDSWTTLREKVRRLAVRRLQGC